MLVYIITLSDQYCDHLMEVFSSREAADQWILKQDKEEGEYWTVHEMPVRS